MRNKLAQVEFELTVQQDEKIKIMGDLKRAEDKLLGKQLIIDNLQHRLQNLIMINKKAFSSVSIQTDSIELCDKASEAVAAAVDVEVQVEQRCI